MADAPGKIWAYHNGNSQTYLTVPNKFHSVEYTRSDLVAKLAAENERLKKEVENWKTSAAGWQKIANVDATTLASTGAVKVKAEPCDHDWFDCSNSVVLPPAKSCRKCGWTVGADEAVGMFVEWPWLSALHPHPRDTNTVDAHETTNMSDKPEDQQEPVAYRVHDPEDDYYGTGPDRLQFHPLAQHDMDNGYRQTPLYGRPAHELSGNTGELIDRMGEAIRGDTTSDDTPWATLSEDRKVGWRGDAERALAVVKEYLTVHRPSEQAVTEAMVVAAWNDWQTGRQEYGPDAIRSALKAAMEAGG